MLHRVTPLARSHALSEVVRGNVYLKLDLLQPSGSFKIRGIGRTVARAVDKGAQSIVSSSGGNAGLAASYACQQLSVPIDVVVPETTKEHTRNLLKSFGANVVVRGSEWNSAHAYATELAETSGGHLVHPFDEESTWEGHASLIHEIHEQWTLNSSIGLESPPDEIVTVCGGGGLLMGILRGLDSIGWGQVPVIACETDGAASLRHSIEAGRLVSLDSIDSVATSLGSKVVSSKLFEEVMRRGCSQVRSFVTSDTAAVQGCVVLANEERLLVEPACGVAIAYVLDRAESLRGKNIVVEVCGGSGASLPLLQSYSEALGIPFDQSAHAASITTDRPSEAPTKYNREEEGSGEM